MANGALTLALAHYFTGKETYADHAARLLRVWFLDQATRMNPNFNHAQAVPGVNTGRGTGMIESRSLLAAADAASLLAGAKHWSKADHESLTAWMREFLDWALTSKNGREEQAAKNNHGTFYDVQIAHLALFTGQTNLAKQTLETAKTLRIAGQIKPDGTQPYELERADTFGYSRFNLGAFFALATRGEHAGVDLWRYESADGRSIRNALDVLMPYVENPGKPWPYGSRKTQDRTLGSILRQAYSVYGDPRYREALLKSPGHETQREALFYPVK
jgi:hypothetical protein